MKKKRPTRPKNEKKLKKVLFPKVRYYLKLIKFRFKISHAFSFSFFSRQKTIAIVVIANAIIAKTFVSNWKLRLFVLIKKSCVTRSVSGGVGQSMGLLGLEKENSEIGN